MNSSAYLHSRYASSNPGLHSAKLWRRLAWLFLPLANAAAAPHDLDQPFGGGVGASSRGLVLARLLANGTLDTSFGSGGFTGFIPTDTNAVECAAVIVQPDGKILSAGFAGTANAGHFTVIRQMGDPTAPLTLSAWRQTHFSTTANSGNAADSADPDGDGVKNLVEYAFSMNPKACDARLLPQQVRTASAFTYTLPQPSSVTGITYRVESGTTPASMTPVADTGSGLNHFFTVPTAGRPRQFLRIKITAP
jgi:hypothetical protein